MNFAEDNNSSISYDIEMEDDTVEDTQILDPADDSSGTSQNRSSSGGYSGDYSESNSSDSSSDRHQKKKNRDGGSGTDHRKTSSSLATRGGGDGQCQKSGLVQSAVRRHSHHSHMMKVKTKQPTQEVNRQIDEIMNLYNVSLQARDDTIHKHGKGNAQDVAANGSVQVEVKHSLAKNGHGLQIGGTMITDTHDPRLNVQQLYQSFKAAQLGLPNMQGKRPSKLLDGPDSNDISEQQATAQQGQCYANLVHACRPFFDGSQVSENRTSDYLHSCNTLMSAQPENTSAGIGSCCKEGSEQSSSGFTSFFNTTKSDSNHTNSGSGGSFSDQSKKGLKNADIPSNQQGVLPLKKAPQASTVATTSKQPSFSSNNVNESADYSDSSSLIVLARVKRKHMTSSNSDGSRKKSSEEDVEASEQSSKRVRIESVAVPRNRSRFNANKGSQTSSLTQSLSSGGSDSGQQQQPKTTEADGSNVEGTTALKDQPTEATPKARQVTDVSRISSGTTTATTGSGTNCSRSNTASKTDSGSGGCGDNSNEQKISEERDSTVTESSKQPVVSQPVVPTVLHDKPEKPHIHHHYHGAHQEKAVNFQQDDLEAKIMEKKRKRMNMRREYEEECGQMGDTSSSSASQMPQDSTLQPAGKPVTLEEVLYFTKTARLLVQAIPPFLAVHSNAAFSSLCGLQSSTVIGTPVASIVSLPDATTANKEGDSSGSDNTNNKDGMSSLSDGNYHSAVANANAAQAPAGDDQDNLVKNDAGLKIDRLIVARGYGHIHEVNLLCMPNFSRHSIEGSEVEFREGNGPSKRRKESTIRKLLCRMSVSPVISTGTSAGQHHHHHNLSRHADNNPNSGKRRKFISVKHYLIQLESSDGDRTLFSGSSFNSADTEMKANAMGITKTEVQARRCRLSQNDITAHNGNNHDDAAEHEQEGSQDSEGSSGVGVLDPVATCG